MNARTQHAHEVVVLAVVHEPAVLTVDYHVPAIALRCILQVMKLPIGIANQLLRSFMPVVSENAADAHHIDRVAVGTQTGNGCFGAHHIAASHFEAVWVKRGELSRCCIR